MTMHERPFGLTLLAIGAAVVGVLALLGAGAWFLAAHQIAVAGIRPPGPARVVGLVLLASGIAELALAYGVMELRPWAWPFGIFVEILALSEAVVGLARGRVDGPVVTLVLSAIALAYLVTPRVRELFRATSSSAPSPQAPAPGA